MNMAYPKRLIRKHRPIQYNKVLATKGNYIFISGYFKATIFSSGVKTKSVRSVLLNGKLTAGVEEGEGGRIWQLDHLTLLKPA